MAEKRTTRRPDDDEPAAEEYAEDLPAEDDGEDDPPEDTGGRAARRQAPVRSRSRPARGSQAARDRRPPRMTAAEVAQQGLQQIAELTGKRTEGVTQVQPRDDTWTVGVEVVEDRRIPSSADVLALYEIGFDQNGDVLSYRRVRRYSRGRGDNGEG
jgi:gas vesicle protein GvpO